MPLGLGLASEPPGPASLWGLAFLRNDGQVHVRGNQRVRPWQNAGGAGQHVPHIVAMSNACLRATKEQGPPITIVGQATPLLKMASPRHAPRSTCGGTEGRSGYFRTADADQPTHCKE